MNDDLPIPFEGFPSTISVGGEGSLSTSKELGDDTLRGDDTLQQDIMRDLGECLSRLGRFWHEPELLGPVELGAGIETGQFDRYELIELVGQGGFGLVFRAHDPVLGRVVAIKVPRPEVMIAPQLKARFLREARAAAALDHPNIVPVYDTGQVGPLCYIASAFCEGTTLAAWLKENPAPSSRQAALLIQTLASALAHAHERGILHRDLKPSNILLQGDPHGTDLGEFVPRISDFGLAKIADDDSDMTRTDVPMGTPPYMAPEQALGRLDAVGSASDVYALGATLYHMLVGRPPFSGQSRADLLHQIVEDDPIAPRLLRHDIARDLETICLKCLRKDPRKRYPVADLLAADLAHFSRGEPILARPATVFELGLKWARRRPLPAAVIFAAVLLLAGAIGAVAWRDALIQRHDAELEREILRANRHAQDAEDQSRLASRHAYATSIREARMALADRKPELAQEILHGIGPEPNGFDPRGFAWRYLWRQSNREVTLFWGHETRILGIQAAPDGKTLASLDVRGNIFLWDLAPSLAPRQPRLKLENESRQACHMLFSSDSRFLVCLYYSVDDRLRANIGVRYHDVASGRPIPETEVSRLAAASTIGAPGPGSDAADGGWDGRKSSDPSAIRGGDRSPFRWSMKAPDTQPVISSAGSMLAAVEDGRIILRESMSGRILRRLKHAPPVRGSFLPGFAAFSDDCRFIGICSGNRVSSWDIATGEEVGRFDSASRILKLAISTSNRHLAILGEGGRITVLDRTMRVEHSFEAGRIDPRSSLHWLAFSPDESLLAMNYHPGDHSKHAPSIWEVGTGKLVARFPGRAVEPRIQFTADGKSLLAFAGRNPEAWHLDPDSPLDHLPRLADEAWAVALSPDGNRLAIGTDDASGSETLRIWDAETGRPISALKAHAATVSALAYSPDGRTLASGSLESKGPNVLVRDAENLTLRWALEGHADKVRSVAYSPDGRTLATASDDRTVRLWDLATGSARGTLIGHSDKVCQAVFSPDGTRVASASLDASARLWDISTGKTVRHFLADESLHSVAFSPDGRLLATAAESGMIDLWDAETGKTIRTILTDADELRGLIFSPDGRNLAAGVGKTVKIWDLLSGQELLGLLSHSAQINSLAFARDGNLLVSVDHAGTIRLWRADPP